jgi:hypothetical protein
MSARVHKRAVREAPVINFTANEIVQRKATDLKPFPNNPKEHTPAQIDAIVASMVEFGFTQPMLIDEDDQILIGHGRQIAGPIAGFELLPTITRTGLTPAQKWALVISDNALTAMTGFNDRLLRVGLTFLAKADYPLNLTGIENVRLATFVGGATGVTGREPNTVPDLAPAISKRGDVWLLDRHRLICGDSSNAKTVARLLGDDDPDVMLTDPPYSVEAEGGGIFSDMKHAAAMKRDVVHDFTVDQLCELRSTNIIFTSKPLLADYLDLARAKKLTWDVGVLHRAAAVPNHNNHLMSDLDYIVLMGDIAPKRGLDHVEYSKLFSTGHWDRPVPWAKPVELIERLLRLYTVAGDLVFEPYCGSGTLMIACENLGRACLAIELNPAYVDLTVRRWEKFAGKKATLQGTKQTFDQIVKTRSKAAA